jgi:hypothetical protein
MPSKFAKHPAHGKVKRAIRSFFGASNKAVGTHRSRPMRKGIADVVKPRRSNYRNDAAAQKRSRSKGRDY